MSAVPTAAQSTGSPEWSGSATLFTYLIPGDGNYAQPTLALDRERLHVEARYNYEALRTGSLWGGYNFEGGSTVEWTFTPMLGAAFGDVAGVAPGYAGSLTWWKLDVYSEGQYLYDVSTPDDSFLYNWSEIALVPVGWLRLGLATQRTRVRETGREIQRGPLVGITLGKLELNAYMLDSDESAATVALSVGWTFGSD
jgi:hypothetical protein